MYSSLKLMRSFFIFIYSTGEKNNLIQQDYCFRAENITESTTSCLLSFRRCCGTRVRVEMSSGRSRRGGGGRRPGPRYSR